MIAVVHLGKGSSVQTGSTTSHTGRTAYFQMNSVRFWCLQAVPQSAHPTSRCNMHLAGHRKIRIAQRTTDIGRATRIFTDEKCCEIPVGKCLQQPPQSGGQNPPIRRNNLAGPNFTYSLWLRCRRGQIFIQASIFLHARGAAT